MSGLIMTSQTTRHEITALTGTILRLPSLDLLMLKSKQVLNRVKTAVSPDFSFDFIPIGKAS